MILISFYDKKDSKMIELKCYFKINKAAELLKTENICPRFIFASFALDVSGRI